ncbi:MAG: ribosome-associated translation inhibitor RaiA [Deltaproteobacteria bacterium]|nr:ribosome-associated translation inhibitor RaiA [Deltaproteobacteria bacterium]
METTFTFRNIEATDGLKDHTLEKMEKLDRFVRKPISAHVIFSVEHITHVAEVTLTADGTRYVGVGKSHDMYPSIDEAIHKILNQVKRSHDRQKQRR